MEELFEQLQDDTRSFWQHPSSGVRRLDTIPPPAEFFRDYVATSTPVILSGGGCFKGGGRRSCWDDLASLAGRDSEGLEVTVDFTPDGRGDCVVDVADSMLSERPTSDANAMRDSSTGGGAAGVEGSRRSCKTGDAVNGEGGAAAAAGTTAVFVKPEERRMKFEAFVSTLLKEAAAKAGDESSSTRGCTSGGVGGGVPYLSHQVCYAHDVGLLSETIVQPCRVLAKSRQRVCREADNFRHRHALCSHHSSIGRVHHNKNGCSNLHTKIHV